MNVAKRLWWYADARATGAPDLDVIGLVAMLCRATERPDRDPTERPYSGQRDDLDWCGEYGLVPRIAAVTQQNVEWRGVVYCPSGIEVLCATS